MPDFASTTPPSVGPTRPAPRNVVEGRRARDLKAGSQVRKTFPAEEALRQLGASYIRRPIHPIVIRSDNTILDGECRWRGVLMIDPDHEVGVLVEDRELTPSEVSELQMISAMHATGLSCYDQALAAREWLGRNPGGTAKELAGRIDRDPSFLTRLLSLWKTIPAVQEAAAEGGRIGVKNWYQLSLLPPEDQAEVLDLYLAGTPAAAIAGRRRKLRVPPRTESEGKVRRIRCAVPGNGAVVAVTGAPLDLADLIDVLSELLKLARREAEKGLDAKTFERVCRDLAKKG